jgi:hypothetical protein
MNKDDSQSTAIANAILRAAELLGNNGAATSMGAIEAHSVQISVALDRIADALFELADAVREK